MDAYNFFESLEKIKTSLFSGEYTFLLNVSQTLACMFSGFILIRIYNDAMNKPYGQFDYSAVIRMFTMLILICSFNTFVLYPIDALTGIVSKGIVASVEKDSSSLDSKVMSAYNAVETSLANNTLSGLFGSEQSRMESIEEESGFEFSTSPTMESEAEISADSGEVKGFWKSVWDTVKTAAGLHAKFRVSSISNVLSWLISVIVKLVRYILICVSGLYCLILGLIGPLVFAVSLIPSFESGSGQWIARYVQISLWVPVTSIIDFVNFKMKDALMDIFLNSSLTEQLIFPTFHIIILDIVALVMLLAVPGISSWIIQSSGASEVNSSISAGASRAIRALATKH